MEIKVINKSKHQLPQYSMEASTCIDLRANRVGNILGLDIGRGGFGHTGKK